MGTRRWSLSLPWPISGSLEEPECESTSAAGGMQLTLHIDLTLSYLHPLTLRHSEVGSISVWMSNVLVFNNFNTILGLCLLPANVLLYRQSKEGHVLTAIGWEDMYVASFPESSSQQSVRCLQEEKYIVNLITALVLSKPAFIFNRIHRLGVYEDFLVMWGTEKFFKIVTKSQESVQHGNTLN